MKLEMKLYPSVKITDKINPLVILMVFAYFLVVHIDPELNEECKLKRKYIKKNTKPYDYQQLARFRLPNE
jgi:hypothetical protein